VVLPCSSQQKVEFLMYNWSFTPVEARADNDRSMVYLSHIPSKPRGTSNKGDGDGQGARTGPLVTCRARSRLAGTRQKVESGHRGVDIPDPA
jgi:hypothetical protein